VEPEIFDQLLEGVDIYACEIMQMFKEVFPALFFIDQNNVKNICPWKTCGSLKVDREFIENARLLCIHSAATVAIVVQESVVELGSPLFEQKARVLLMQAEWSDGVAMWYQKMIFNADGKFLGFGEPEIADVTNGSERRALNVLPKEVPTTEMREAAFAIFEAKPKARI
jgi:hypothetical protein